MSCLSRFIAPFAGFVAILLTAGPLSAQTLTWGMGGAGGSGQWDTATVDWYNGSANVPWTNGDSAVFAGTAGNVSIAGSVTASQVTFNTAGYILQNGFLQGTSNGLTMQTNADTTVYSSIFGASPFNTAFTKNGTGLLLLNGGSAPVFFGTITVADGELRYGNATLNSSTPFVLGNTTAAALTFGSTTAAVGSLSGGGTTGGGVRPAATSGSSTLTIYGVGDATYGGTFAGNGSATLSLQKNGSSTQTLTNASPSLTGTVTVNGGRLALSGASGVLPGTAGIVLNSGIFQLDNSTTVNGARLAGNVPITLNGGTLNFVGNNAALDARQSVGQLYIASGASAVSVTTAGTGAAQLTFLKPPVRTAGATVSFSDGGRVTLTGTGNTNGILGGYATVGADWAAVDAGGNASAYSGYASDTTTAGNTDNLRITTAGGTTSLASVQSRNSLNLVNTTGSTAATVDLGTNGSLTLASGGLLTSGSGPFVIQNGQIASGTGELIVTNQNALTIASIIVTDGFTKSGAGTLTLTGRSLNKGTVTVNQGTLQISSATNLGTSLAVALNGGTLQATAGFTSTASLQGTGGTMDTGSNTVTFTGKTNTGSFTKAGVGILSLTGQVGSIGVNAGTLQLTNLTGTTTSSVTLNNGRLEAGTNGLQFVTSNGGANAVISPGPHGQAQTLPIAYLTVVSPTVIDFDVGSAGHDLLSISFNLNLAGTNPALLFRFNNLGGVQTGIAYPVLQLPSSQAVAFTTAGFGIDSVSMAAGYQGAFSIVSGTVNVTFSAVPEPSAPVALLCGLLGVWGGRTWQRRRAAREKYGN